MTPDSLTALFPSHCLPRGLRRQWWSLRRRLSPQGTAHIPFAGKLQINIPRYDRLARRVYLDGCSDFEQAGVLAACLKPGGVYFDVGAHVGQFSLLGAHLVGAAGQSHAFEATPATYKLLEDNLKINDLPQLTINHLAVFSGPGEVTIQVCDPADAAFNSISTPLRPDGAVVDTVQIPSIALDDYCAEHGITHVDLIKIDVNGPELQVIQGARKLLTADDAPVLYVEFNDHTTAPLDYTTAEMRAELEGLGYELFSFDQRTGKLTAEPKRDRYEETVNLIATKQPAAFNA